MTDKPTITLQEIEEKVRELADLYPDRTYEKPAQYSVCQYVHEVTNAGNEPGDITYEPGCIMGHALIELGIEPERLVESQGIELMLARLDIVELDEHENPHGSAEELTCLDWLSDVQQKQDSHDSWGKAVADADLQR